MMYLHDLYHRNLYCDLEDEKGPLLKFDWKNFSKENNRKERDDHHIRELKEAIDRFWLFWFKLFFDLEYN